MRQCTNKMGLTGDLDDNHPRTASVAETGGENGMDRRPSLICLLAWLMSPTLALPLFPNRAFRPGF